MSKLAIALSDYVAVLWLGLVVSRVALVIAPGRLPARLRIGSVIAFAVGSVVYALVLLRCARSKQPAPKITNERGTFS